MVAPSAAGRHGPAVGDPTRPFRPPGGPGAGALALPFIAIVTDADHIPDLPGELVLEPLMEDPLHLAVAGARVTLIPTLALATVREDIVLRSLGPDAPRRPISGGALLLV